MGYDVFVSYSHEDSGDWVHGWLVPNLRKHLSVIYDEHFARGSPLTAVIEDAIRESKAAVIVFTPHYLTRDWTADELELISRQVVVQKKRAIPILRERCDELPDRFAGRIACDFTRDPRSREELKKLIASIRTNSSEHILSSAAPAPSLYRNFDIELGVPDGDRYPMVAGCEEIDAITSTAVTIPLADLDDDLAQIRGGTADPILCGSVGRKLHDAIFPEEVLELWDHTVDTTGTGESFGVVRLRLHIRDHIAARLPWELLHRDDIAIATVYPVIHDPGRYPVTGRGSDDKPAVLLVNTVAPDGGVSAALESHLRVLSRDDRVTVWPAVQAHSADDVRLAVRDPKRQYDILHLLFHPARRDGVDGLLVRTSDGDQEVLPAKKFAELLSGSWTRLVVLSAAAGSARRDEAVLVTLAECVASMVTAVVTIPDTVAPVAATKFAKEFYTKLAHGCPVEACMSEGRFAIMTATPGNHVQWALPLLYNNDPDALCFGGDPPRDCFGPPQPRGQRRHGPQHHAGAARAGGRPKENIPTTFHQTLVGRDAVIAQAWAALAADEGSNVVLLKGAPGFGKTAVARELAWQAAHGPAPRRRFDSVTWVSSSDPQAIHPNDVLRRASQHVTTEGLAIAAATVFKQRQLLKLESAARLREIGALFARGCHLFVIDDVSLVAQETVRKFITAMPRTVRFIVTSARGLGLYEQVIEIGAVTPPHAHDLAAKIAHSIGTERPPDAPAFGGNPFVIEVETRRKRYDIELAERMEIATAEYVDTLFETIPYEWRRVLAVCTTLPFPAAPSIIRTASGLNEESFAETERALLDVGLITSDKGQLTLCSTLRALFRDGDDTARRHLPDVTVESVNAFMSFLDETRRAVGRHDVDEFMEKVRAELESLIWSIQTAFACGLYEHLKGFREFLEHTLYRLGFWKVALEVGELFFVAAGRTAKGALEMAWSALYPLARIHFHRDDFREAERWAATAMAIFHAHADRKGVLAAKRYIGRVRQNEGRLDEARVIFQELLEETRLHQRSADVATAIENIASLEQTAGNLARAEQLYQMAIAEYRKDGQPDPDTITPALHELGRLALLHNQPDKALEYFDDALVRLGTNKWRNRYARILYSIGSAHEQRGELDAAIQNFQEARNIFNELWMKTDLAAADAALVRVGAQHTRLWA